MSRVLEPRLLDGENRLRAGRCPTCGYVVFPQQPWCPRCVDVETVETAVGPTGRLRAFTAVHHPAPGARLSPPYAIGLADFEPGVRVMGLMAEPYLDGLEIGAPVTIVTEHAFEEDGEPVLTFKFRA